MKIALYELLVTVRNGGIQTSYWETAKRLAAMGHEVHIYGGDGPIRWRMPEGVKIFTFPYIRREKFPDFGTRFRKFSERLSFGKHALPSLYENRYDIIYVRKPYEMPIALYVKKRTGAKVVFRSGGTEFYAGYGYLARRLDSFLSCSEYNSMQIYHYCGLKPGVLYNGVDTERFRPLPKDRGLMARYGIKEDDFVLISVSRLVGWKGIQYGIKALTSLRDKKVKYLIVGDGEYSEKLMNAVRDDALEESVVFTGNIRNDNVPLYLSLADAAVFPTIGDDDAFPNAVCEAMSCGKPAIGTTKGGIPEAIVDGQTGFLVKPADPDLIAEKVDTLMSNPVLCQKTGKNARERAVSLFSWDAITTQLEGIFYDVRKRV